MYVKDVEERAGNEEKAVSRHRQIGRRINQNRYATRKPQHIKNKLDDKNIKLVMSISVPFSNEPERCR